MLSNEDHDEGDDNDNNDEIIDDYEYFPISHFFPLIRDIENL